MRKEILSGVSIPYDLPTAELVKMLSSQDMTVFLIDQDGHVRNFAQRYV